MRLTWRRRPRVIRLTCWRKDIWVVWSLAALFESPFGSHLVFKGGTALSKAYEVIRRFFEDVDITYDIRALAPQLSATRRTESTLFRRAEARKSSGPMELVGPYSPRGFVTTHIH